MVEDRSFWRAENRKSNAQRPLKFIYSDGVRNEKDL